MLLRVFLASVFLLSVITAEDGVDSSKTRTVLHMLQKRLTEATMRAVDRFLQQDTIPLFDNVMLVRRNGTSNVTVSSRNYEGKDWILSKILSVLRTHELYITNDGEEVGEEARLRRHHYKHMFPLMVVGFMTMSSFLVPMGFQFMAMLAGKALLLSKMALMLSSSQSYKRLWSPFVYPHYDHYDHHHYDRTSP